MIRNAVGGGGGGVSAFNDALRAHRAWGFVASQFAGRSGHFPYLYSACI